MSVFASIYSEPWLNCTGDNIQSRMTQITTSRSSFLQAEDLWSHWNPSRDHTFGNFWFVDNNEEYTGIWCRLIGLLPPTWCSAPFTNNTSLYTIGLIHGHAAPPRNVHDEIQSITSACRLISVTQRQFLISPKHGLKADPLKCKTIKRLRLTYLG